MDSCCGGGSTCEPSMTIIQENVFEDGNTTHMYVLETCHSMSQCTLELDAHNELLGEGPEAYRVLVSLITFDQLGERRWPLPRHAFAFRTAEEVSEDGTKGSVYTSESRGIGCTHLDVVCWDLQLDSMTALMMKAESEMRGASTLCEISSFVVYS